CQPGRQAGRKVRSTSHVHQRNRATEQEKEKCSLEVAVGSITPTKTHRKSHTKENMRNRYPTCLSWKHKLRSTPERIGHEEAVKASLIREEDATNVRSTLLHF
ncbi:unnamed protein product, partial [Ectocarpus sp. 8 AP-2014]